mgnify:CR=1 FL=1
MVEELEHISFDQEESPETIIHDFHGEIKLANFEKLVEKLTEQDTGFSVFSSDIRYFC